MRHPARFIWERGISVIPVPLPSKKNDGKRPLIAWREYQERLPSEREMARWFDREPTNYAVITGRVSGIVVVDVDDPSALPWVRWNLEPTPWRVQTGRAIGLHLYYRYPDKDIGNRARIAGLKLDVRGNGGYVIGPGSSHVSGRKYIALDRQQWLLPKSALPVFDASALDRAHVREARKIRSWSDRADRARRYLVRTPCPPVGAGSDQATFVAACRLVRGFGLSSSEALLVLSEWAPDFDAWWLESKVSAAIRYGNEATGSKL